MLARRKPRSLVLPPAVLWPLPQAKMKRTTEVSTWKPTAVALGWPVAIGVSVAFALVYNSTCGPPKSFAYSPATIPPKLVWKEMNSPHTLTYLRRSKERKRETREMP